MIELARKFVFCDEFVVSSMSILSNPVYILRKGLLDNIAELAQQIQGDVLDFGCGKKPYKQLFNQVNSYTGVDKKITGHDHAESEVDVWYDGEILPFANASFDAVLSFEVFEHIFNIEDVLLELHRIIKPGGKLLVSTPFFWGEHEKPYDFFRYTSFGMISLLRSHGFMVSNINKTTTNFDTLYQLAIVYAISHILPSNRLARRVLYLPLISLMHLIYFITRMFVTKRKGDCYLNMVVLASKSHIDTL